MSNSNQPGQRENWLQSNFAKQTNLQIEAKKVRNADLYFPTSSEFTGEES